MSVVIGLAGADVPAGSRPAFDAAARQHGFVPNTGYSLAANPNGLDAWLDVKTAMSTVLDVAPGQGGAHAVGEVNA
jgi:hypothetical protein